MYITDEGGFIFEDIKKEFEEYGLYLLKQEEEKKELEKQKLEEKKELEKQKVKTKVLKEQIIENLKPLKNKDYGLGI